MIVEWSVTLHPAGLLQPLPVPSRVWADISIDFIEALPKVHGKSVILTIVDQFSKYAHFIALGHPYTAAPITRAFFHDIVRLHGFSESIVSDRDPVFTGRVWGIYSTRLASSCVSARPSILKRMASLRR
jgi:hypothetical protein